MSKEKKRVVPKVIASAAPRKRPEPEPEPVVERRKPSDDKYIRVCYESKEDSHKTIQERIQKGEIRLAYYGYDNGKGYHYYLIIKN